jgi:hypothetical protein
MFSDSATLRVLRMLPRPLTVLRPSDALSANGLIHQLDAVFLRSDPIQRSIFIPCK